MIPLNGQKPNDYPSAVSLTGLQVAFLVLCLGLSLLSLAGLGVILGVYGVWKLFLWIL